MPTIVAIKKQFGDLPDEVQNHLKDFRFLLEKPSLEAALAYLFMMIEQGRYRAIKCVLVRKLKCDSSIIDKMLADQQLTRKSFGAIIKKLVSVDLSKGDFASLGKAESVRERAIHGRKPSQADLRQALSDGLKFISAFGQAIRKKTEKNPFGNLQGLTSRSKMLNKDQTKWIVLGVLCNSETANGKEK
jgi:hypothetical protein